MIKTEINYLNSFERRVELADKEVNILHWATGIDFKNIPVKITNPIKEDLEKVMENIGIHNKIFKKAAGFVLPSYGMEGLADPVDHSILDYDGRQYISEIFGVSWGGAVDGVTDVSLHEVGHLWLLENAPKEYVEIFNNVELSSDFFKNSLKNDVEMMNCGKLFSEGMASYLAKRGNDYIRTSMTLAVENAYSGDLQKSERTALEYEKYYDRRVMDNNTPEEDIKIVEDDIKNDKKFFSRLINVNSSMSFVSLVAYRLGYSIVQRMIDVRRENGMNEAEALLDIAHDPPMTLEKIKTILRV